MTDIIKHWIVKKLGLPVSFNRGGDRLRHELSNGHLIGEILRKYHLISDDMLMNIHDSVCQHHREKNMHILHSWLHGMSFDVESSELHDISQGKPGTALSLLYRLYLWLEGPGSQPGIRPRLKSQELQELAVPSEESVGGPRNWICLTNMYMQKQAHAGANDTLLTFDGFLKDPEESALKQRSSLVVNVDDKADQEKGNVEEELDISESFPELKSREFLESLKESLPFHHPAIGEKSKLVVSPTSVPTQNQHVKLEIPSCIDVSSLPAVQKPYIYEPSELESEPYLEIDDKGLGALECGLLPSFYIRNYPFGNTTEKLQAGNLYFHSKAMMVLNELKLSGKREFKNLPKLSRLPCENDTYIGAYEEAMLYREERKRRRTLKVMENTVDEMNKFEEKLLENSGNTSGAYDDCRIKIYRDGRGDWTEASAKINSLKSRRRRDKICFQKRCSTRKMMAVLMSKLTACDMHEELDKVIHSKLLQKSRQEMSLAHYCTTSHLEKRAFLDHTKYEEELLLNMAMIQNYREYLHAEQLVIIKEKVEKITEKCDDQIINEVLATKNKAQFIMDIKFCEEIFVVILKTAIQYSDYRTEYGSDPPTALVAEWRESFYMGSCVTIVKRHIRRSERPKSKADEYALDHANRCKKKREKKEKSLTKIPKKSKSSVPSVKSNNSYNQVKRMSTIMEYVEEEELPVNHPNSDEKSKKKKMSLSKKNKRKDVAKEKSIESKNSNKSDKVKKSNSDVKDAKGKTDSKTQKKKDSNDKKTSSKNAKDTKRKTSGKNNNELDSSSKTEPEDTKGKGKKTGVNAGETEKDSKDIVVEKTEDRNSPDTGLKRSDSEKPQKPNKAKPVAKVKNGAGKEGKNDKKAKKTADVDVDNDEEEEDELPEDVTPNDAPDKDKKPKKPGVKPKKPKK